MIQKVFVRAPYNYDTDVVSHETGLYCEDVSLAKQSFADECDINVIVARFGIGYEMPEGVVPPTYADFTGVMDFHTACNAIAQANEAFDALPAEVRYEFNNDPGRFVDFCSQEQNLPRLRELGLAVPAPEPEPSPAVPPADAQSTT